MKMRFFLLLSLLLHGCLAFAALPFLSSPLSGQGGGPIVVSLDGLYAETNKAVEGAAVNSGSDEQPAETPVQDSPETQPEAAPAPETVTEETVEQPPLEPVEQPVAVQEEIKEPAPEKVTEPEPENIKVKEPEPEPEPQKAKEPEPQPVRPNKAETKPQTLPESAPARPAPKAPPKATEAAVQKAVAKAEVPASQNTTTPGQPSQNKAEQNTGPVAADGAAQAVTGMNRASQGQNGQDRELGQALGPSYKRFVPPAYPEKAKQRRQEGFVVLRVYITAQGRADRWEVVEASNPVFVAAAEQSLRLSSFHPYTEDGQARDCWVRLPLRFTLR